MKVITVSNKVPTQPYYCWAAFHESLKRFGHEALVLGMNEPWGGLMTKPRKLRSWLRANVDAKVIIYCDSWDVVFAGCLDEIEYEFLRYPSSPRIIWNAEKTLFPDPTLNFPETGTPYRYLNSGFAVGYDWAFLRMLELMDLYNVLDDHWDGNGRRIEPNDQLHFQEAFVANYFPMALDSEARICQTLHAVEADELDLTGDKIKNRITGSIPMAFHMNGQKELWRDKILTKLNLPL